jgi:hypothetical protein
MRRHIGITVHHCHRMIYVQENPVQGSVRELLLPSKLPSEQVKALVSTCPNLATEYGSGFRLV